MEHAFVLDDVSGCLVVDQEWITPSYVVAPTKVDPAWKWKDAAGHKHDASLSSAEWKTIRVYWCDSCNDEHEESELVCSLCGEHVTPARVTDTDALRPFPGLRSATVSVTRGRVTSRYHVPGELLDRLAVPITVEWVAEAENDEFLLERTIC